MFQVLSMRVQETDQSCCELVAANDITLPDLALAGHIGKNGAVIMREVAEFLQVPYSTATGIVDKLVNKKILMRVYSQEDRRIVKVSLTPEKGNDIFQKFLSLRNKLGEMVLSDLDEKDFEDIGRIMKKMSHQIYNHKINQNLMKEME